MNEKQEEKDGGRDIKPDEVYAFFRQGALFLDEREPAGDGWGQWHYFMWLSPSQQELLEKVLKGLRTTYRRQRWLW